MVPVIRYRVRTERNQSPVLKFAIDHVRAGQSRDAKKWPYLSVISQCNPNIDNALVDFPLNKRWRQFAEVQRMIFAVGANGMPFRENAANRGRVRTSHFADKEKRRLYALSGENIQNLVREAWYWSVVESQHDLLI